MKVRRRYFFGLRKKPIRRFRRRIRIYIGRKLRRIKRYGRRWRVRIGRRMCGLKRFGRKWYLRRRRKWRKIKRVRLILRLRKRKIRIRRRKKVWYIRRRKRWTRVRRRVRCSIRFRRRRVKVKLVGRRRVRIFRKGRYGKARRIRFRRELVIQHNAIPVEISKRLLTSCLDMGTEVGPIPLLHIDTITILILCPTLALANTIDYSRWVSYFANYLFCFISSVVYMHIFVH